MTGVFDDSLEQWPAYSLTVYYVIKTNLSQFNPLLLLVA